MSAATIAATDSALADAVLEAAREAIDHHHTATARMWPTAGVKNRPLLILLEQLTAACEPIADAIADNAWDDQRPIPADGAKHLAQALHRIADTITAAAAAPDCSGWSLPSMTGKELV